MATQPLNNKIFRSTLPSGQPNSLGTIEVYVAGSGFATLAVIYSDAAKSSELENPATLSSNGELEMWHETAIDYRVRDSGGSQIGSDVLSVAAATAAAASGSYNLIVNPSFELATEVSNEPDSWTLAEEIAGTILVSATSVAHGAQSLAFTGAANGGGTATSTRFDVLEGKAIDVEFTYKTDAATSTNSVKIKWYTKAGATVSTTTVYSATTGQPSTFTTYYRSVIAPATATRGELILGGIENGGTVETGVTNFDGIIVRQGNTVNPTIYDENGNEVIKTTSTASAVNEVNVTNAITATNPKIGASGEANTGLIIEDSNGNEMIIAESVASAVNEIKTTNAATGVNPKIGSSGEANTGLIVEDSNGNEIIIGESVASAVNELTITNAATGTAVTVQATGETNASLNLVRSGTGEIQINGAPVFGEIMLDTPVSLVNNTSTASTGQTAVDITAQTTGVAVKAILNISSNTDASAGGGAACEVRVGEGDETLSSVHKAALTRADTSGLASDTNQITVNLAAGEIFDYSTVITGTTPTANNVTIHLAGYKI